MIIDGKKIADKEIRSYLMIGQSNMAGRGHYGVVPEIRNENCYMLRMGRWQAMVEPINPDREIFSEAWHSGIGLAASFADELAKYTGEKIGLIPCADGGTCLREWMPGEVLYDHAVMQTRLAMRSSTFSGILWHQGESDCNSDEDVASYEERFLFMISSLKKELGVGDVPVLIGEISENIHEKFRVGERPKELNRVFYKIAEKLPNCRVVSAKGFTLNQDGIHFDSPSCRVFGKRYFEELLNLK